MLAPSNVNMYTAPTVCGVELRLRRYICGMRSSVPSHMWRQQPRAPFFHTSRVTTCHLSSTKSHSPQHILAILQHIYIRAPTARLTLYRPIVPGTRLGSPHLPSPHPTLSGHLHVFATQVYKVPFGHRSLDLQY